MANIGVLKGGCLASGIISEAFLRRIEDNKHTIVGNIEEADYFVINSCGIIGDYLSICLKDLHEINDKKKPDSKIIVVGCLTRIPGLMDYYKKQIPDLISIDGDDWIVDVLNYIDSTNIKLDDQSICAGRTSYLTGRISEPVKASFRISRGCNRHCTFCKGHYMDNTLRSLPIDKVLGHINNLVKMGTRHIDLIGDNVTEYGIDLYKRPRLHEIIQIISQNPNIEYISVYELTIPDMYPELLQELSTNKKIRSVIIQIQMASDNLLDLMGRQHTVEELARVLFILSKNPYLKVSTYLMTGFPEETMVDVKQTAYFLQRNRVELAGVNLYQDSPYIPSSRFKQLSEEERQEHYKYLLEFQSKHNYDIYKSYEPEIKQAMVLSKNDDKETFFDLGLSKWGYSLDFGHELPHGTIVPIKQAILTKDDNDYAYKLVA